MENRHDRWPKWECRVTSILAFFGGLFLECLKAFRSFWEGAFVACGFFLFSLFFSFFGEVTFPDCQKSSLHLISLAHLLGSRAWTHQRPLFLVLGEDAMSLLFFNYLPFFWGEVKKSK